jgi:hypothetical protein
MDCGARQLRITVQILGVEDRAHVTQTVARDGCDLSFGAADQRQPGCGGPTQVIKGDPDYACFRACLAPGGTETV